MKLADFYYELPEERIARFPLPQRSASRLLCMDKQTGSLTQAQFTDLVSLVTAKDLIIFNNTKVIPARLFGYKATGGKVELLIERVLDDHQVLGMIRASKTPQNHSLLRFAEGVNFEVLAKEGELYRLICHHPKPVLEVIESIGEIPIPPYFDRVPDADDKERYQTIFAKHKGSVAAPTAGLHFDEQLMTQLAEKSVGMGYTTLHVGAGTFGSVRVENIADHTMHPERVHVSTELCERIKSTKALGGRIIAVGTTVARSLESASCQGSIQPFEGETAIFIYPGFEFKCVDALITNFHLPCSTLLMLVSAFGGYENIREAYKEAISENYRFFSYGDAMFIA